MTHEELPIYTDGSYYAGVGGWAWAVDTEIWQRGSDQGVAVTNNTMEIQAVIKAIRWFTWIQNGLTNCADLLIVTDSQYVAYPFTEGWLYNTWIPRNWRNASGCRLKNVSHWKQLVDAYESYPGTINFLHIRGHGKAHVDTDVGHVMGNSIADYHAGDARKERMMMK